MLLATGEHQSATLMSMALQSLGVPAISLTGPQAGIPTDGRYGRPGSPTSTRARVRAELAAGKVVIVAGFQGMSVAPLEGLEGSTRRRRQRRPRRRDHDARPRRLGHDGRGPGRQARRRPLRDLHRRDGIFTADPRIVPEARQLGVIGYEEMLELAHQGAQVMQIRAVELGWVNDVVIEVLSSFEDAPGTQIREDPLVEQRNKVRGIAHDRNVAKVTLVDVPDRPGVARSVFGPLADAGINVDMIVQNVGHGGATDLSLHHPPRRAGEGEAHARAARRATSASGT